jgi:mono/diheme cytochrome c family protein
MKSRNLLLETLILSVGLALLPGFMSAQQGAQQQTKVVSANDSGALRIDGEKRFRANCGRCHQSPHKFPPRMMATIVRHMRVRATITDEDMRIILLYMSR